MKYLYETSPGNTPSANNSTSLKNLFRQKDLYDQSYPDYVFRPSPFKITSEIMALYGRVDTAGFSVIPKQQFVSQLDGSRAPIFALDIVKECFAEMVSYWGKLTSLGKLSKNSVTLKNIKPASAITQGIRVLYEAHIQEQIEFFNKEYVKAESQIKNYADYERDIRNFSHYLRASTSPFTLSEFCTSKMLKSTETGLVIEIAEEDPSSDSVKFQGFIRDPNYESYTRVAYRFGFKVDRDIPWRIYFDLSSEYAKKKMAENGIYNVQSFFERYYDKAVDSEFDLIVEKMSSMYKSYIDFSPSYSSIKPCPTSLDLRSAYAQGAAKVEVKTKEVVTAQILSTRYETSHWLRLYAYFRSVETDKPWTQNQFDNLVREAANIYRYRSEQQAVHYLESSFTDRTQELFQKKSLTNKDAFDTLIYKDRPTYKF